MFYVKLAHASYDHGCIFKFATATGASLFIADALPRSIPDNNGLPLRAEMWEDVEPPEAEDEPETPDD